MKGLTFTSLILFLPFFSFGQLNFNLYHGPYAMARGNIYSIQKQAQSIYGNPAQLAEHPGWSLNASATNRFEMLNLNCYQAGIKYNATAIGNFSVGLLHQGSDQFRDQKFHLSYGRKILTNMDLGIQFDWLHNQVNGYENIDKITVELGAVFRVSSDLLIALHLFNPLAQAYARDRTLSSGMTLGLSYQLGSRIKLMAEVEKDFYHNSQIKSAIDYTLMDNFALCIGMYTTENAPNITGGLHYKLQDYLALDLAIAYHPYLGISSALGMDCYLRD
jgi:hypothetical protein